MDDLNIENSKTGAWSTYQRLVLHELQRLNQNIEEISKTQNQIGKEVEVLKVKSAFFGTIGGLAIMSIDSIVSWFKS